MELPQNPLGQEDEGAKEKLLIEKMLIQLRPFIRTAYLPKTQSVEKEFNAASKIGGFPYLRNLKDWPVCANCKKSMQLFLQLNLNNIPINTEDCLIQLFYCTNNEPICEIDCQAYFPFSESAVCRKIKIEGPSAQIKPNLAEIFPEKKIISWEPVDDYPIYDELEELGIDMDIEDYEILEINEIGIPITGDKLFGWPHWIQAVEYPFDRKTATRMNLLFQIDSEVNLPYMFGDGGIGHLTQSPDNPDELAFGWACS